MAIKYTQSTLDKIIKVLDEVGYVLRFEKGNFNSGYCILEHKKVVVVNKFLDMEGRINTLSDILILMNINKEALSPDSVKILDLLEREAEAKTLLSDGEEGPESKGSNNKKS